MYNQAIVKQKDEIEVEVILRSGSSLFGFIFVLKNQRVIDFLNDSKQFIPVRLKGGRIVIISKSSISHIFPMDEERDVSKSSIYAV